MGAVRSVVQVSPSPAPPPPTTTNTAAAAAEFLVVTGTSSRSTADFPTTTRQQLPQHVTIVTRHNPICFSPFRVINNRQKTAVSISVIPYFWVLWLCCLTNIWVVTNNFCTKYNIGRIVCCVVYKTRHRGYLFDRCQLSAGFMCARGAN